MHVFVLLFNVGTDNEGLHTLRLGDLNLVLMFEDEDDATRYAMLLEAQDFPTPVVEAIDPREIEQFCEGAGYDCRLVPQGFVPQTEDERLFLAPPEKNLQQTDWQVENSDELDLDDFDQPTDGLLKDADLDRIRRQLEGLL